MHFHNNNLLALASIFSIALTAQETPKHEPSAIRLEDFVVTALPFKRSQVDVVQSTTVLASTEFDLKIQPSLGETLAQQPGISSSYFGPGASRPIIRGLGGDRIRMLGDGMATMDASTVSPDHAVSLEPMLVEHIEIVRGPASLLYGSSAVGGVVNAISHRIDLEAPERLLQGRAQLRFGGAGDECSRALATDLSLKTHSAGTLILHLDGLRRDTDDLKIPGYALSEAKRAHEVEKAQEHGEPVPEFEHGSLSNSAIQTSAASAGLSWISESLALGLNRSGHHTRYGVPGHQHEHGGEEENHGADEGVDIDLRQRRWDLQGEFKRPFLVFNALKVKAASTRYHHLELEDGAVGTRFDNRSRELRLELQHGDAKSAWQGAVGFQGIIGDFSAKGDEAFLPASRTRDLALFLFEETKRGDLTLQWGARIGEQNIELTDAEHKRSDMLAGLSLGLLWTLDDAHVVAFSLSRTERAPNAQELHANGPHTGTQSYEIGDRSLPKERAHSAELSLRRKRGRVTGELTAFLSAFDGFIYERATGEHAIAAGSGWSLITGALEDEHGSLPVYRMNSTKALLWGAEAELYLHLHEGAAHRLDLRMAGDITLSRSLGRSLPRIPPARLSLGLRWEHGSWLAGVDVQEVLKQSRVAEAETTTPGYTLVSAHAGRHFDFSSCHVDILLSTSNLLNHEARVHSSFLKDLIPLPGRSVTLGLSVSF